MIAESEKPPSGVLTTTERYPIPSPPAPLIHGRRFPWDPGAPPSLWLCWHSACSSRPPAPPWRRPAARGRGDDVVGRADQHAAVRCARAPSTPDGRHARDRAPGASTRPWARADDAQADDREGPATTLGTTSGHGAWPRRERTVRPVTDARRCRTPSVEAVTGTSVDPPSAPVQAPAATASGPAPDAVAPALIVTSRARGLRARERRGRTPPAAVAGGSLAMPCRAVALRSPAGRWRSRSRHRRCAGARRAPGARLDRCAAPIGRDRRPSTARALLTTRTGRPLAVFLALLAAIVLFLAIHRRVDRQRPEARDRAHRARRRPVPMTGPRRDRAVAGLRPTARPAVRPAGDRGRAAGGPRGRGDRHASGGGDRAWSTSCSSPGSRSRGGSAPARMAGARLVDGPGRRRGRRPRGRGHRRVPQPAAVPRVPRRDGGDAHRVVPHRTQARGLVRAAAPPGARGRRRRRHRRGRPRRRPHRDRERSDVPALRGVRRAVLGGQRAERCATAGPSSSASSSSAPSSSARSVPTT